MTCISCKNELPFTDGGFVVCPTCGSVNVAQSYAAVTNDSPKGEIYRSTSVTLSNGTDGLRLKSKLQRLLPLALLAVILLTGSVSAFQVYQHKQSKVKVASVPHKAPTVVATSTSSQQKPNTTASHNSTAVNVPAATPGTSSNKKQSAATATTPAPKPCSLGAYSAASDANTPQPGVGLRQIVDAAQYYTVYGYTATQIRSQLNQCSPATEGGVRYDATTNWWVKFYYYWYTKSNGMCALQNVGVTVHVTFAYPKWDNSPYATSGLNTQWQSYLSMLTTHEQGHKDLALQYANTLYNGLQNYPDTACSSISQSATAYGNSKLAELNQAENNYDIQTNHGATQGAIFP